MNRLNSAAFISSVFLKPPIWDRRLKSYFKRVSVDKCWKQIGEDLGIEEAVLRKKWKYFRDQFAVELGKVMQSTSEGETYEPKWVHFKSLHFLKDVVKARNTPAAVADKSASRGIPRETTDTPRNNLKGVKAEVNLEDDSAENYELNGGISGMDSALELPTCEGTSKDVVGRKRKRGDCEFNTEETSDVIERCAFPVSSYEQEGEDMSFFRSLLPHVAKIPDNKKLRFRNRMQELVEQFAYPEQPFTSGPVIKSVETIMSVT